MFNTSLIKKQPQSTEKIQNFVREIYSFDTNSIPENVPFGAKVQLVFSNPTISSFISFNII